MVLVETFGAFLKVGELVAVDEGYTGAETFSAGAVAGGQRDGADAVVQQFVQQFFATESRVSEGEVETIGQFFGSVVVVNNLETVVGENFLHDVRLFGILTHVV